MKTKLPFVAVVIICAAILSACGTETAVPVNNSQDTVQQQTENQDQTENQNQAEQPNPSGSPRKGGGPMMDLAAAAKKLNVSETALKEALGMTEMNTGTKVVTTGKPAERQKIDLAAVAKKLNVTETALQEALGIGGSNGPQGGIPPQGNPPSDIAQ